MQATKSNNEETILPLQNVLHMVMGKGEQDRLQAEYTKEDFTLPSVIMKDNIWAEHLFQATDLFLVTLQELNEKERKKEKAF